MLAPVGARSARLVDVTDDTGRHEAALRGVGEALVGAAGRGVESEIFVSPSTEDVIATIDSFSRSRLGSGLRQYEFFRSGVGSVHGVHLDDGRSVVIKIHSQWTDMAAIEGVHTVRRYLFQRGFPTPEPLVGPTPLAMGTATVETMVPRGPILDGREPAVRQLLAVTLARLIDETRPFGREVQLPGVLPFRRLYPMAQGGVDFDASSEGAEWIDEMTLEARLRHREDGRLVVAHDNWRVENIAGDVGRVTAVFDWSGLRYDLEPVLVGRAAAAHSLDSRLTGVCRAPSPDEIMAFVDCYEDATGHRFRGGARSTLFAAAVYFACVEARSEHSRSVGSSELAGTFSHLIRNHTSELLNG